MEMQRNLPDPKAPRPLDVKKELDAVIGKYEERPGERLAVRVVRIVGRGLLGAALAVAVSSAVIYTLHKHVKDAQTAPVPLIPGKPIPVQILPPPSDTRK